MPGKGRRLNWRRWIPAPLWHYTARWKSKSWPNVDWINDRLSTFIGWEKENEKLYTTGGNFHWGLHHSPGIAQGIGPEFSCVSQKQDGEYFQEVKHARLHVSCPAFCRARGENPMCPLVFQMWWWRLLPVSLLQSIMVKIQYAGDKHFSIERQRKNWGWE